MLKCSARVRARLPHIMEEPMQREELERQQREREETARKKREEAAERSRQAEEQQDAARTENALNLMVFFPQFEGNLDLAKGALELNGDNLEFAGNWLIMNADNAENLVREARAAKGPGGI